MKNNLVRYIFVIIALALIGFAIYYFYNGNEEETIATEEAVESESEEDEKGTIKLGVSGLDSLNPLISKNQYVQDISKIIFEPLFNLTEEYELEEALGIEWSKTDTVTYLVTLRNNVSWQNGADFTAEDVKFTVESIKNLGSDYIYYSNVKNIDYIEIISDNIIKIHLFEEEAFFEYNLTFPILCSSFFGEDDMLTTQRSNIPLGTGVFKVTSIDVNSQIDLEINTNWWNSDEISSYKIEKITIKVYSSVAEIYNAYKLRGNRFNKYSKLKC